MSQDDKLFDTSVVHDGYDAKGMLGSLSVPIFQTSTYAFETAEQGERMLKNLYLMKTKSG